MRKNKMKNDHYQEVVFLIFLHLCFTNYKNKLIRIYLQDRSACYTFRKQKISKEMPNCLKIEKDEQ